jgi:voltage-gated potassium channel
MSLTQHAPVADDEVVGDPSPRLARYVERTEMPLDLLALLTLWIVVVPPGDFGPSQRAVHAAWVIRIAVSVVYGIDLLIRATLAERHVHYVLTHPLIIVSVFAPPVRVIFSIRVLRSLFRRGNLRRFLVAASVIVLDFAVITYLYERHAPGSSIHTVGETVWWSFVTVTTVGYGDYVPVTPEGRISACFIMAIGLLTLAVITAQVASSFVAQDPRKSVTPAPDDPAEPTLPELQQRLTHIETLLVDLVGLTERLEAASGPGATGT